MGRFGCWRDGIFSVLVEGTMESIYCGSGSEVSKYSIGVSTIVETFD